MGSRIRKKVEHLFEVFMEIAKPNGKEEAPFIIQQYPPDYDDEETLRMIPKFAYPCSTDSSKVDHFTFVLTDLEGMFRFGYCRHATGHQTCLCIVSWLPWHEVFYKMLDFLAEITNRSVKNNVTGFLRATHSHEVPISRISVTIVANEDMFNFTAPDSNVLPSIPGSRNLTEYYNAVDPYNMMVIFASMLHERRIYMTSKKLSRLTASIHAAEALLYPMHWQHLYIPVLPAHLIDYISAPMPFVIGIHSNLVEKLKQNRVDVGDAVVVDLDANTVTTQYDDLGDLPEDVSSYLKRSLKMDVVKNSMMKTGDAISVAFLHALVRLIGGYRDALKFRSGEPITFDPESFIRSRPSQSTQSFLEGMLGLQIFQQFIYGRLEILNAGVGFRDIFESQATLYADKLNSQSKYKEWLKTVKKSGKKGWNGLKIKAAPMMSTAVQNMKVQGKKAMADFKTKLSGLTDNEEKKGSNQHVSRGVAYGKSSKQRPVTTHAAYVHSENMRSTRPPRPPPPTRVTQLEYVKRTKSPLNVKDVQDDNHIHLSYQRVDMSLMTDSDIQAAMQRSTSDDTILNLIKTQDSSDESSSDSSDSEIEGGGTIISFNALRRSSEGLNSTPSSNESLSQQQEDSPVPRTDDKLIHTSPRTSPPDTHSPRPVAAPRMKTTALHSSHVNPSPLPRNRMTVAVSPKSDLPQSTPQNENSVTSSKIVSLQDGPLIWFDSSKSDATDAEKFKSPGASQAAMSNSIESLDDEDEVNMRPMQRNVGSRVSLTRSEAFRREPPAVPLRTHYLDDTDDLDGPKTDSVTDIFDPLSDFKSSASSSNIHLSTAFSSRDMGHATANYPFSGHSFCRDSSDLLKHEWSLATLAKGPSIKMPVTAHPSRTSYPRDTIILGASQNTLSLHRSLPSSSFSSTSSRGSLHNHGYMNGDPNHNQKQGLCLVDPPEPHQSLLTPISTSPTPRNISFDSQKQSSVSPRTPGMMNFVSPTPSSSTPLIRGSIKHVQHNRSGGVDSSFSSSSSLEPSLQSQSGSLSELQDNFDGSMSLEQHEKLQQADITQLRLPRPRWQSFD